MEVVANNFLPGDQHLIDKIVYELKARGIFDQFRKECFADVDTKPAYQNLRQRVEGSVSGFLREQSWRPDMNKNQVREMLRKTITESGYLETGVERIVDQVVNPKINTVFLPKVEEIVYNYLGIKKPAKSESSKSEQIDLLPTDLEAVSPESEPTDKKDDKSAEALHDLDESKTEEDESPPFEPLEEQSVYVPQEENSVDSHLSGFSGLISHESNQSNENKVTPMEIDSQMSRNSSDSRLSIVTSDENYKMEICEDSQSKSAKSNESNNKHKAADKHRSRSENKSEKSDRDRKSSKDPKPKHSSSSKDKDKSRSRKDSKGTTNKNDKDKSRDKEKEKNEKDRKSSTHNITKHSSHSSTSSGSSSSKDRSIKKDSSKSDKDKDKDKTRSSSNHKDSKSRDKSKDKSSSNDKYKHSSSSHSDKHKKDRDKKKDSKSKDDHYSSREKRNDRRSTDRDSNDGQSRHNSSSSSGAENHTAQTQRNPQDSNSGCENSGNADQSDNTTKAPVNITGEIQNSEVIISPPEAQRVKVLKPKCASNIQEALRLRKIRKQLAKLEKKNQLSLASVDVNSTILLSSSIDLDDLGRNGNDDEKKIKEENSKIVSELEVVPSPLQHTVISQDNWDAMEAKLREEVCSEFKEYDADSFEEENSSRVKRDGEIKIAQRADKIENGEAVDEERCLYFDEVDITKIEFLLFVERFVRSVEKFERDSKLNLKRKFVDNDLKNNNRQFETHPEKRAKMMKRCKERFNEYSEVPVNEKFSLPLSPAESDKSVDKKDDSTVSLKSKRNNVSKVNSQRYSSDDLYKPRSTFASSRRRGAKTLDN